MNRLAAIVSILALGAPCSFAGPKEGGSAGQELPTLYELTAHSQLVVAAKVLSGQVKLAQVRVDEVFRGTARPGQKLQIAFRDFNLDLGKEERILFPDGETDILFLTPELDSSGKPKGADRFILHRGRFGKRPLPREGDEIYREALRKFATLSMEKDHRKLYRDIRALVGSPNPLLAEAALHEVLRLDLVDRELLPEVLPYLRNPSPQRRVQALRLIEEFFHDLKPAERSPELEDEALQPVISLSRNDPDEGVRTRAVDAMAAWGGEEVYRTLKAIAELDAAQAVRYQAQLNLLRHLEKDKEKPTASEPPSP
ncbi:MAG TPA: HEAT repeat domain-containing protein [Candidatus Polarisedimenticolia bacterium]|nr:HEAT repeat domain-containing protein [Candidatus Polarisedimenticolia bacterium]